MLYPNYSNEAVLAMEAHRLGEKEVSFEKRCKVCGVSISEERLYEDEDGDTLCISCARDKLFDIFSHAKNSLSKKNRLWFMRLLSNADLTSLVKEYFTQILP